MEAIPNIDGHPNGSPNTRSHSKAPLDLFGRRYVHRLWQTDSGPQEVVGRGQVLDLLAQAGLLVPKGLVLSKEAHREFLDQSGLLEDLRAHAGSGEDPALTVLRICLSHRSSMIKGELNRAICDALIGLGSPSVTVASEGSVKRHLKSIPEAKDAIKKSWLSLERLERQLEATSRGLEIPTWPVLILAEESQV
jgi:hypothetical protein